MYLKIDEIQTREPFTSIFPQNAGVLLALKESMEEEKKNDTDYFEAHPLVLGMWIGSQGAVLIDGHTRLRAAKDLGIKEVPVYIKDFDNEDQAIEHAIYLQRNRRNLTPGEIVRLVQLLDQRRGRGGDHKSSEFKEESKGSGEPFDREKSSAEQTADKVGTSRETVKRVRYVLNNGSKKTLKELEEDKISVNAAYERTKQELAAREEKQQAPSPRKGQMNRTNEKVSWATWTWNPVTGCTHGCPYCYAKEQAELHYRPKRIFPEGEEFTPHLWEERLDDPTNTKIPKELQDVPGGNYVFVSSMGDLFGEWVPREWIDRVIQVTNLNRQFVFIFLTKNPERYNEFSFPPNTLIGTTVDCQEMADKVVRILKKIDHPHKFVSCEPMTSRIMFEEWPFEWLIIGGRSRTRNMDEAQPVWEDVVDLTEDALNHWVQVYHKPNLHPVMDQFPIVSLSEEGDYEGNDMEEEGITTEELLATIAEQPFDLSEEALRRATHEMLPG